MSDDKPNFSQLMNMAQDMQKQLQDMQKTLVNKKVTGKAGGAGVEVEVTMNGQQIVEKVHISDGALKEDKGILEDLVTAATNNAIDKIKVMTKDEMVKIYKQTGMPMEDADK